MLPLTRNLVVVDVETHDTCEPENARIVELSIVVVSPNDDKQEYHWLINPVPAVLIGKDAYEKHGISNIDLVGAPSFADIADTVLALCRECDFCGYYVRYDLRVLASEFRRCDRQWSRGDASIIDPHRLWQVAQPRRLGDAVREFLLREPADAHRTSDDATNTLAVLHAQLERFSVLPKNVKELHHLSFGDSVDLDNKFVWRNNEVMFNFGQHGLMQTRLKDVPPSYLHWMLSKSFSFEVKEICRNALNKQYPER
jgi:DNA polymerase-3 subunit epsilon